MRTELRDKVLPALRKPATLITEVVQFVPEVLKGINDDTSNAMVDISTARATNDILPSCAELLCGQPHLKTATNGLTVVEFIEAKCG
jgi:hypothetical protein